MSLRYLLDTNILSEPSWPSPRRAIIDKLDRHEGRIATASVVWHEAWFGVGLLPKGHRRTRLEEHLLKFGSKIPILPYDEAAASWHAKERARLVAIGRTPPFEDGQIAAIAAVNELVLVTNNVKDFKVFKGLDVESWAK